MDVDATLVGSDNTTAIDGVPDVIVLTTGIDFVKGCGISMDNEAAKLGLVNAIVVIGLGNRNNNGIGARIGWSIGGSLTSININVNHGELAVTFDADIHEGIYPVEVTYTAVVDGADESASLTYEWDFDGDGTVDNVTYTPVAKHQYANGGMVSVVLKVTDGTSGLSATSEKPDIVKLAPAVIYVDAASEGPVSPYASWATAALQPADAVAVAVNGCEIKYSRNSCVKRFFL